MSLYYHVPNKEAILDGVVDLVFREIEQVVGGFEVAESDDSWKAALRARILGARRSCCGIRGHQRSWTPAPASVSRQARYVDSIVGTLHSGGFSYDLIHHSMHALGSRMFGFTQELGDDNDTSGGDDMAQLAEHVPHLASMLAVVARPTPSRRSAGATTSSSSSSASTSCSTGSSGRSGAKRATERRDRTARRIAVRRSARGLQLPGALEVAEHVREVDTGDGEHLPRGIRRCSRPVRPHVRRREVVEPRVVTRVVAR